jgi:uncharacterized protein (TIGR03435 family)
MKSICIVAILVTPISWVGRSQEPAQFEVASVRIADPQPGGSRAASSASTVSYRNTTLSNALGIAFQVATGDQIVGPSWIRSDRYDIVGKASDGTSRDQIPELLKRLLTERFALKLRTETRDLRAYVLTLSRKDSALRVGTTMARLNNLTVTGERRRAENMDMPGLAKLLSFMVRAPVLDRTTLSGYFDFELPYSMEERGPNSAEPSIFTIVSQCHESVIRGIGAGFVANSRPFVTAQTVPGPEGHALTNRRLAFPAGTNLTEHFPRVKSGGMSVAPVDFDGVVAHGFHVQHL